MRYALTEHPIVYVAARYASKARAATLARELEAEGAVVNARWLGSREDGDSSLTFRERRDRACEDLADVAAADAVVLWNPIETTGIGTGGCHVEVGYALALWKPVVVIGSLSNLFHYLDQVLLAPTARTAVASVRVLLELQQQRLYEHAASGHGKPCRWVYTGT